MNDEMQPRGLWEQLTHEQARALSLESIDTRLDPADAARLGDHLDACPECAAIDSEYRAVHHELHGLAIPEVPRNLWARTSAALDMVESTPTGLSLGRVREFVSTNVALLSTAVAAGLVIVLIASTVVLQSPGSAPRPAGTNGGIVAAGSGASSRESTPPGPLAVVGGTSYWISETAGVYEIKGGNGQCPAGQAGCSVSGVGQTLGSVQSGTPVSAVIAPDASRAAVWTDTKIAVVPLADKPATVPLDLLTPRPTSGATATPTATQEPAGTPASDQSLLPTSAPVSSPAAAPTATETALATSTPVAILSGYEIVGLDPEFSADGLTLAFAARPKDHGTGPDVFVWHVGQAQAHAVTFRHADQMAGWFGDQILISEFGASASSGRAAGYASYVFDPKAGTAQKIDRPMLLPSVDPTGRFLVYWAGTVELDHSSGIWNAAAGDLYFESWSNLSLTPTSLAPEASPADSPTPIATAVDGGVGPSEAPSDAASAVPAASTGQQNQPPDSAAQVLGATDKRGTVRDWIVRWDASGRHAAIWVAESAGADVGRMSLFSIDRDAGTADGDQPLPASERVTNGLGFDDGHLVYKSVDGKTYVQDIAALKPVTVATPTQTTSGQPSESPTLQSADPSAG